MEERNIIVSTSNPKTDPGILPGGGLQAPEISDHDGTRCMFNGEGATRPVFDAATSTVEVTLHGHTKAKAGDETSP